MPIGAGSAIQVDSVHGRPRRFAGSARPASLMAASFDLPGPVPLRRSYIIACTPRCGSTFLCTRLWATGVLAAHAEYFGYQKKGGTTMMARLKALSPVDYLQKLLE